MIEIQMKNITNTALIAALALSAHAANGTEIEHELPTLVVTGTLWESELQSTTASVSVLDAESLKSSGTQHFGDIVNAIPNLTWTGGTSRPRYIQIRGIGENSQFEGETPDSSVRFLIDDLDLTGIGSVGNLFDVQQVEVLRGPQAGAFGANAAGGVVQIVTNDPTPYWTGQVEGTIGNDSLFAGGLAVGGPILENDDSLSFRLSLHQLAQDGFRDNRFLGKNDTNERDELTTRLKLRWIANEDWQWDGTLLYADADNGYDEFSLNNTEFDTFSDEPGRDEQETLAGSIRGTWSGHDDVELLTVTSYATTDSLYSFDGDWGAGAVPAPATSGYTDFLSLDRERDTISQEFRLNSKAQSDALGFIDRWTIGLYGQALEEDSFAVWDSGAIWNTEFDSESFSLFGQATHELNESTRITLQLRAEYYEVDVAASGDFYGTLFDYSLEHSETLWGGNLTLEHDLCENAQAHISLGRGYKAGGASTPNFTAATDITYKSETLWTIETGLKASFLDNSIDTSITAFYTYRDDPQFRDSEGASSFFDYITTNGDTAEHLGLEADATWYFAENWSFGATLGLLEADRDSYTSRGVDVDSRDIANAPNFNYSARLAYEPTAGFFTNIGVVGSDQYYESNSHNEQRSAFAQFNAAIGYRHEGWTLTVWGRNLFDEEYEKRVFFFDNGYGDTRYEDPADPQQFGVTLNYSW
jgi:outer membrane receptor protein involved in Fe transport